MFASLFVKFKSFLFLLQCYKLLFFAKSFVLLSCLRLGLPQDIEVERLKAEIQIDDLELVDACSNIAQAKKTAIVSQNFSQKVSD